MRHDIIFLDVRGLTELEEIGLLDAIRRYVEEETRDSATVSMAPFSFERTKVIR